MDQSGFIDYKQKYTDIKKIYADPNTWIDTEIAGALI